MTEQEDAGPVFRDNKFVSETAHSVSTAASVERRVDDRELVGLVEMTAGPEMPAALTPLLILGNDLEKASLGLLARLSRLEGALFGAAEDSDMPINPDVVDGSLLELERRLRNAEVQLNVLSGIVGRLEERFE